MGSVSSRFGVGGLLLSGVLSLSGCAPMLAGMMNAGTGEEDVIKKTADYFGVGVNDIEVSDIRKGAMGTAFKTRYDGNHYNCTLYYGAVDCKRPGQ